MKNLRMLVVDDDITHSKILYEKLTKIGYVNIQISNTYKEASELIVETPFDIYFIDFYLDKGKTGLELVQDYLNHSRVPVIFISSFYGPAIFEEVKNLENADLLSKNAMLFELQKCIESVVDKFARVKNQTVFKDFILVKKEKKLVKVNISDIEFIEVDSKYLIISIGKEKYIIRSSLSDFNNRLPQEFIKIHQSIVINIKVLVSINTDNNTANVNGNILPISRNYKKHLIAIYYKA